MHACIHACMHTYVHTYIRTKIDDDQETFPISTGGRGEKSMTRTGTMTTTGMGLQACPYIVCIYIYICIETIETSGRLQIYGALPRRFGQSDSTQDGFASLLHRWKAWEQSLAIGRVSH